MFIEVEIKLLVWLFRFLYEVLLCDGFAVGDVVDDAFVEGFEIQVPVSFLFDELFTENVDCELESFEFSNQFENLWDLSDALFVLSVIDDDVLGWMDEEE